MVGPLLALGMVLPVAAAAQTRAQAASLPPRVVPVAVVPRDLPFDSRRLPFDLAAIADVRAWYARVLRGLTFTADPLVVRRSRSTFMELADSNFQAWWPLLQQEFTDLGVPWKGADGVKLLLLVQGAGAWAGAESENDGLQRRDDAGRIAGGSMGGFALIGDSSVGGLVAGVCPTDGLQRGTAWWCNWDTYRGTITHELGHTWGLPHPDAIRPDSTAGPWNCPRDGETVLQCHWGFPTDSLLTYEQTHLRSLRFFTDAPEPRYRLLAEMLPTRSVGDVRLRRPAVAHAADVNLPVWVDDLTGQGATGFPWAVVIGADGAVEWRLPAGCHVLAATLGRERGAGGSGRLAVTINGDTVLAAALPAESGNRAVEVCGPGTLHLAVSGQLRFRAVVGNARLYRRDGQE